MNEWTIKHHLRMSSLFRIEDFSYHLDQDLKLTTFPTANFSFLLWKVWKDLVHGLVNILRFVGNIHS